LPPYALIAGAMNLAMVDAAERDHIFIADLPAQRSRLHETEVVGIGVLSPANETRLLSNKPQMLFVAMATRLRNRKTTRVDIGRRVTLQPLRRMWSWNRCRGRDDSGGCWERGTMGLQFG
jgi:hypothetical protein